MDKKQAIRQLAEKYDSFYFYDQKIILDRIEHLKKSFPDVEFLYSVKCNPHGGVLDTVFGQGFGADAASLNEVKMAAERGVKKDMIYYSAPAKAIRDIEAALDKSVIIADSLGELERIRKLAQGNRFELPIKVGLRINPAFSYDTNEGHANKFGVDEAAALEYMQKMKDDSFISITGIHTHIKSQELNAGKLCSYYGKMFALAGRCEEALGRNLEYINLGSGIGIPFDEKDREVDVDWLGEEAAKLMAAFRKTHESTRIFIESGRYAPGPAGIYVTKVMDKKLSYGKTFVLLKNTLNGFMRPSAAKMMNKYFAEEPAFSWEPMFTGLHSFQFKALEEGGELEKVSLAGNLCTGTDLIAEDIEMPRLEVGDIVYITNAGAYAASFSPMQFSSQERPAQVLWCGGDSFVIE
jgi:diaminopimelate decarboxylase